MQKNKAGFVRALENLPGAEYSIRNALNVPIAAPSLQVRAVVANSEGLRSLALETDPEAQIRVIPNGVDTHTFAPTDKTAVPDPAQDPANLRLIFVGRLIPRKGVDLMLDAMRALEGVTPTIVGDGPEHSRLQTLTNEYGVRVEFLGEREHSVLPEL